MTGVYLKEKLNVLSCAVEGRPGRSAYDTAVAGGYDGTPEEFAALLAGLPAAQARFNAFIQRVNAILEYMDNEIGTLQAQTAALTGRVTALENRVADLENRLGPTG